jgi:lipid II:glycine glycyltransferase (peptidoglycan interpeptide bridge formation enzyme)
VRSLDHDPESLWMDYEHKVRKNVKTATRAGLRVEVDLDGSRLDEFLEIYSETLQRREAPEEYFFPKEFFLTIVRELAGEFVFFHVIDNTRVVASELVLVSAQAVYSFLGGTRSEAFALRPNDLLKHSAFEWAHGQGKSFFVLGGGYEPEDGIFRYKKSFSPRGVVPFCVGTRVLDASAYWELVKKREAYELRRGEAWEPRSEYFPAYRS